MKTMRLTALLCAVVLILSMFCACGEEEVSNSGRAFGHQLEAPAVGEEIAVMHTNLGDIYIRLFPEEAPKAVENFKTLSNEGYYDGILFHRVINDFMIQSGDPTGTGAGGESCWGETFEDEFDAGLGNLRGALAMANTGVADTNGSQFFINQRSAQTLAITSMREYYEANRASLSVYETFEAFYAAQNGLDAAKLTGEILSVYEQTGGNIHLDGPLRTDGGHTVFGQVFKGMDIVDAIAAVETTEEDLPMEFICIDTIEFVTYTADMAVSADTTTTTASSEG